ncbi:SGNH/GDSL hydrolase family protein [Ramlibacter sp. MMS24-I3-19]|uniref:SGNH/GDSL hydrolase family protein n=1 Tax=Ramlibacter sp. MMS24-I3-19 TaxID=3416606 RepID=UPI003D03376F
MDRRAVVGWLGVALLGGCGGGGGGGAGVAEPVAAPATSSAPLASNVALSSSIALWGDSLTAGYGPQLQTLEGSRPVFNGGVIGETSMQIADRQVADTAHRDWVTVFWYGHNNLKDPPHIDLQRDPAQVKADIARSVATLAPGNTHFLVLSVVNQDLPGERRGEPVYQAILQLNADLAAAYPNNYVDIRSWLVAQANPNHPDDAASLQADLPARSLRWDEVHLTADGYAVLAKKIKELIDARGW